MAFEIVLPFVLGLSYFLLGMYTMRAGFHQLAGARMESILLRFTRTSLHSFGSGLISTFVLQSSSAVTVLTIGLTQAGVIRFPQTVGIILGTNVGTTVTTELIALRLEQFAVPMLLIGVAMWLMKPLKLRAVGLIIGGFGLIFLGMDTMQVMAKPLEESHTFRTLFLESNHSVWIGLLTGTLLTALIQSSSATTAITMGLMVHQVMTMETALAVVLGANIGTCATALLASIGTNAASRQVAWLHTWFNAVGSLLFLPFLSSLAQIVRLLTLDPAMQIAHAQLIFNLVCSLLGLPFAAHIARFTQWLVPDKKLAS
ncbi:MAG: Na/Pi cotransporter family protein [Brevibacillus sp.]|nr:Na/Pi cotransporter family protein [Brevibacillus sp.]